MIPIFIKCSHRAFYLDRLLASLAINLVGRKDIILLNDGIKDKYLEKLFEKYSFISERKSKNCGSGADTSQRHDPASFWSEEISNEGSANMLLLEEDTWLRSMIDLQAIENYFSQKPILALFMHFLADESGEHSSREIYARETWATDFEVEYFHVNVKTNLDYYSLFGMAHSAYRKDYWLSAYRGISSWVHEKEILGNALKFLLAQEASHSGFHLCKTRIRPIAQSGMTTGRKDSGGYNFQVKVDWNLYNETLNQAWLDGEFDAMEGFPSDFSISTIGNVLRARLGDDAFLQWDQWRQHFVKMYRKFPGHLATPA